MSNFDTINNSNSYVTNLETLMKRIPNTHTTSSSVGRRQVDIYKKPETRFDGRRYVMTVTGDEMEKDPAEFILIVEAIVAQLLTS